MPSTPRARRRPQSHGYSLVEVVAAVALMASALVPALELVRDAMEQSVQVDRLQLLALYGVAQQERQLGSIIIGWASETSQGDLAADGFPEIRFETVSSDDPLNGGITDLLMDVRTTVYFDNNGDDALTAGEPSLTYRTKLSNLATYSELSP